MIAAMTTGPMGFVEASMSDIISFGEDGPIFGNPGGGGGGGAFDLGMDVGYNPYHDDETYNAVNDASIQAYEDKEMSVKQTSNMLAVKAFIKAEQKKYIEVGRWMQAVGEIGGGDDVFRGFYGKDANGNSVTLSRSEVQAFGLDLRAFDSYMSELRNNEKNMDNLGNNFAQNTGGDPPNIMQAGVNPNEHWIGPIMIGLGSETISKPFSLGGKATKGTSIASSLLRKALPYRSPTIKKITTNILGRSLSTSVLGGAIARSIPVLGWIWTGVDATIYFSTNEDYIKFQLNTEYNGIPTNAPKW